MPATTIKLPPKAAAALARGEWLRAIKLLRDATGLSLQEAKEAVETVAAMDRPQASGSTQGQFTIRTSGGFAVPPDASEALAQGRYIEAIALLRGANPQLDNKTAEAVVDDYLHPASSSAPAASEQHEQVRYQRVPTVVAGDSHSLTWLLVLAVLVAVTLWWLIAGT